MAFEAIHLHEDLLGERFLDGIRALSRVRLYGVPEVSRRRVPTFAVAVEGIRAYDVAAHMIGRGIYVWSGHHYAVNVMDRLGKNDGGLVRIGFTHYNTIEEVDRALEALSEL